MRKIIPALALILLGPTAAGAQDTYMKRYALEGEDNARFRECRIAITIAGRDAGRSSLPASTIAAMREQIEFVMAETAFRMPSASVDAGAAQVRDVEAWMLAFSRQIAGTLDALEDGRQLDAALLACQPMLWAATKDIIDELILWREEAVRGVTPPALRETPKGTE